MEIRFIKLGNGGCWEASCIQENTIRLGYESDFHQQCINDDWEEVRQYWLQHRKNDEGAATRDISQIRDFYELLETDVWITFYQRKLYWCHAEKNVTELPDGTRIRNVIGAWSCHDRSENRSLLAIENIDGRVTKVQGFRGTICRVQLPDYLLRKINGEVQPEVEATKLALNQLKEHVKSLIEGLWWKDFELLIDLIFAKSGWQRISVLGKTEKDIDLDIFSPVTQKRAFVQVKSSTTATEIDRYHESFKEHDQYNEAYLIFHTLQGKTKYIVMPDNRVHIWDLTRVSELVIHAGLIDWLITKRT